MENKNVAIISEKNATVGINYPPRNFKRTWAKKGARVMMPLDVLEEAFYDPGIEYLFKTGILNIEDMEVKIKLGLEEEGTKNPTKLIILSDEEIVRALTVKPIYEFETLLKTISMEQIKNIADKAIEIKATDMGKVEILGELLDTDLVSSIRSAIDLEREEMRAKGSAK